MTARLSTKVTLLRRFAKPLNVHLSVEFGLDQSRLLKSVCEVLAVFCRSMIKTVDLVKK